MNCMDWLIRIYMCCVKKCLVPHKMCEVDLDHISNYKELQLTNIFLVL